MTHHVSPHVRLAVWWALPGPSRMVVLAQVAAVTGLDGWAATVTVTAVLAGGLGSDPWVAVVDAALTAVLDRWPTGR